jgi:hypothetical protein
MHAASSLAVREASGHLVGTPQGRAGEKEQEDCGIARSILFSMPLPKYTFSFLFFFLRVAELVVVLV